MASQPPAVVELLAENRTRRLFDELRFALSRTDRDVLTQWGGRSAARLLSLGARRLGGITAFVSTLGKGAWKELSGLLEAAGQGNFVGHVGDRTAATIDGSLALGRGGIRVVSAVSQGLISNPRETAPKVLAAFLGFYAGSGGQDGNGGIPDLDLLAGIDVHRSLLTHSLIAGVLAEGALLAIADLASQIHGRLPADRDRLWDELAKASSPLAQSLAIGTSAGIAYHLLVDAFIQPAPYHGLPFSMPIEAHQAAMAASGVAEGLDVGRRSKGRDKMEIVQGGFPEKSTGRKVVDGIASGAVAAQSAAVEAFARVEAYWRRRGKGP